MIQNGMIQKLKLILNQNSFPYSSSNDIIQNKYSIKVSSIEKKN